MNIIKSTKKKFYFIASLFLIILVFSLMVVYHLKQYEKNDAEFSRFELNNYLKKYSDEYTLEVLRCYNNIIYGSIISELGDSFLMSTYATFSYNIQSNSFNIDIINNSKRLNDYIISNNFKYSSVIEYNEILDLYSWKIYKDTVESNNFSNLILSGNIYDVLDAPAFYYIDNNNFLVVIKYLTNDFNQKYELIKINSDNDSLNTIISDVDDVSNKTGTFLYDNQTIFISNNNIYYSLLNSDYSQTIWKYNLITQRKEDIYTNYDENYYIFNYIVSNQYAFIQLASNTEKSTQSKNLILELDNNSLVFSFYSKILSFPRLVDDNTILFHSSDNNWDIFSFNTMENKLTNITIWKDNLIFPKYILINNCNILIQTFDNKFYVVNINT